MTEEDLDRARRGVLGDIHPTPAARDRGVGQSGQTDEAGENDESLSGGSKPDNGRQGTSATGGDSGNLPE